MKTASEIALTYLFLLIITLFTLLLVPRTYAAEPPPSGSQPQPSDYRWLQSPPPWPERSPAAAPKPASPNCRSLVDELSQMRKAQNHIILSLADNHDMFAEQLSDLSFELALYKKTVPQKALQSMDKSSEAYRLRSQKARETAEQLNSLTTSLINRIHGCLK